MPSSPNDHDFQVAAPEAAAYLEELHRENVSIRLSGVQGDTLSSRIVALDPAADLLGLEIGPDAAGVSQRLVAEGEITATAYLSAIRLQFELDAPVLVKNAQGSVLRCALPQRLLRFQRRQAYRVQPASAVFPRLLMPQPDGSSLAVRVLDISIGGLALQVPQSVLTPQAGQTFDALTLQLDRATSLRVRLRVQHVRPWTAEGIDTWQVGSAFVELGVPELRSLQVYVDQTQKRWRRLKIDR